MRDSACRWFIAKKGIVKKMLTFLNSRGCEKISNLDWSMQISFFELASHISRLT